MFVNRLADFFFLFVGDTKKIVAKSKSESKIVTKNEGTFFFHLFCFDVRNFFVLKIHIYM